MKYHANDATSGTTPATQYKNAGTAVTLSGNTGSLLRSGYTYDDWNTEADGGGADYAGGDSYLTDAAMTLFAKWTVNSYTLSYGGNKRVRRHAAHRWNLQLRRSGNIEQQHR